MEQWLYLLLSFAALTGAWRIARPWVERRFSSLDGRAHLDHRASAEARERRLLDKNRYFEL